MQISPRFSPAVLTFLKSEDGVSIVEFALVGLLIAVVFVIGLFAFNKTT